MSDDKPSQIAFMPYAPFQESFVIGNYKVWNFKIESSNRIKDEKILNQVKNYFNRYYMNDQ